MKYLKKFEKINFSESYTEMIEDLKGILDDMRDENEE